MMFFDFFLSSFRKLENRKFFNEDTDMSNMRRYFVYVGFVFIFNIYIYRINDELYIDSINRYFYIRI